MKVLLADKLSSIVAEYLLENGHQVEEEPSLKDDPHHSLKEYSPDVLVVRSTKVSQAHIESCPSLGLIIRAGAGVNTIDLDTASGRGIFVANCPGRNGIAVAELVMGHILNWDRHTSVKTLSTLEMEFGTKNPTVNQLVLLGQTLAICGMGAIGSAVVERAKGFGLAHQSLE